ncbi:MAG: hypothetical protein ACT4TC_10865 [Myxococcaceae bacterium]
MRAHTSLPLIAALSFGVLSNACQCGDPPPPSDLDSGNAEDTDSGTFTTDAAVYVEADGGLCLGASQVCGANSAPCCFGSCDNGLCKSLCGGPGESCSLGSCCGGVQCTNSVCSGPKCVDTGGACAMASQCCTGLCGGDGKCAAIPGGGTCKVLGTTCSGGPECCSSLCRLGACAMAASCRAYNEVCSKGSDCCSGLCSGQDGGSGYCITPTGGPGCDQAGVPCGSGGGCCSRVCADLGAGATVCQPVTGCRVAGDYCPNSAACCGAQSNAVTCSNELKCGNGIMCRAPGTICGKPVGLDGGQVRFPDGGLFTVNNETNCCDGYKVMGDEQTCRLDTSGVPRCFGGGSASCPFGYTGEAGCCIALANPCDFKDACCDGALCLAGTDGGRVCTKPTCGGIGTTCTDSSTCCAGTQCLSTGELSPKACQIPPVASMPDAGVCKANGGACTGGAQCCSGICSSGTCQPAAVCQGSGGACSGSADCCVGLSCQIPSGATIGTCATGATCSGYGQTCSPNTPCCSGGVCRNTVGQVCDGTTACTCQVVIN